MSPEGWWDRAFGHHYPVVYAHRDEATAHAEASFVKNLPGLDATRAWLELACGAGRHQRAFTDLGLRCIGLDYSRALLLQHQRVRRLPIVRGDMRQLPFCAGAFGVVTQLFTAFGYFQDERDDLRVLREVHRVLQPKGHHVLDLPNPALVRARLVPESQRTCSEGQVCEKRRLEGQRVVKDVWIRDPAGYTIEHWTESVRLYEPAEIDALYRAAGFRVIARYGEYADIRCDVGQRHITLAERES